VTEDFDLVVVGFGAAGAAAALTAAGTGAKVLVLEKQRADEHTPSTRMSGGIVLVCDDVERATDYLDACAGGMVPRDVTRAWMERGVRLLDWFRDQGIQIDLQRCGGAEHPQIPGADAIHTYQPGAPGRLDPSGGGGPKLWAAVAQAVHARPEVEVRFGQPVRRLLTDAGGRVTGVRAEGPDGPVEVRARAGVVLACGGFEYDEAYKRDFLRTYPVHFYGNPGNSGDGVRMAQAVGADLWHMNQMVGRAIASFPMDDGTMQGFIIKLGPPGYVITDRYGRRFADEESQALLRHDFYYHLLAFDSERGEYPRNPCYWFFDARRLAEGPLTYTHIGACGVGVYDWSADNRREVERGWIATGSTPAEAARAAGVADPDSAADSIEAYNRACAQGRDPFGRRAETLVPIDAPPYACVPLYAGGSNTSGGPRRDARARVVDVFGGPIPGLFAAGELGQALGLRYPGDGGNLSDAFCFGQIAAETALAVSG
jgi:succinate dehydrogenase/fumarate reductase flavoprotein subunit